MSEKEYDTTCCDCPFCHVPCCCDECKAFILEQIAVAFGPNIEEVTKLFKALAKTLETEERKEKHAHKALCRKNEPWRKGPHTEHVRLPQRTAHRQYRRKKARF